MRKLNSIYLLTMFVFSSFISAEQEATLAEVSQAFGYNMVQNLDASGLKLSVDEIIVGMKNAMDKKEPPLTEDQFETALLGLQQKAFLESAEKNLAESNAFLQENAKAQGVTEIIPGKLQCKIVQEGMGEVVKEHTKPLVHYTGKYVDGTLFGASSEEESPIELPLDETIPGCAMGIVGMREGGKRILYIHPDFAYGISGQLPPNKCLIFEIEVVKADTSEKPA